MTTATPTKLRDGSWGVRVSGRAAAGQTVRVQARNGKTWETTIEAVIWTGTDRDGATVSLCSTVARRAEPLSVDGRPAIRGQHWSSRGHGPVERLCAGGCGRRVSARYAECYSCHRESLEAM